MADHSQMKLGRAGVRKDPRTLKLAKYLPVKLPPPIDVCDYTDQKPDWGMMVNDRLGDCTIAGCAHAIQIWTMNTGSIVTVSDDKVLSYYEQWDGYVPNKPETDQGGVEIDVLNKWRANTFDGHKILAYAAVDLKDRTVVKQAMQIFGGLYIGVALPMSAQGQDVWDVVPNDGGMWGGHCVVIAAYDKDATTVITWGQRKRMTWAFFEKYCDEAYAIISEDWLGHYGGDNPVNIKALTNDLQVITA